VLAFGLATEGAGIPATLRKPSPEQKAWWALGKELGIEPSADEPREVSQYSRPLVYSGSNPSDVLGCGT
jgi:hypothetical protein